MGLTKIYTTTLYHLHKRGKNREREKEIWTGGYRARWTGLRSLTGHLGLAFDSDLLKSRPR